MAHARGHGFARAPVGFVESRDWDDAVSSQKSCIPVTGHFCLGFCAGFVRVAKACHQS